MGSMLGVAAFCTAARIPLRAWQEMGIGGPLTLGATVSSHILLAALCRMDARSVARHSLVVLGVSLPLLVAFGGFALGLSRTISAAAGADVKDLIVSLGLAESTNCLVFGSALTAGLAVATGATLAFESKDEGAGVPLFVWLAALATFAFAVSLVLGVYSNGVSGSVLLDPQNAAGSQLVTVERFHSWMVRGALAASAIIAIAAGFTVRLAASRASSASGVFASAATVAGVIVVALGGLVATDRFVVTHRLEGFARHLDAFQPLSIRGEFTDTSGVVVVPGLVVETSRRGPTDAENLRRVAGAYDAFAIDQRVPTPDLRALVDALVASGKPSVRLLGVLHPETDLPRVRAAARTPFAGTSIPLTTSLVANLVVPEGVASQRALRTTIRAGQGSNIVTSDGAPGDAREGEAVFVILGRDATPKDLVATLTQLRDRRLSPCLVSSTATLPASIAELAPTLRPAGLGLDPTTEVLRQLEGTMSGSDGAPPPGGIENIASPAPARTEISRDAIRAAFASIRPAAGRCYEQALRRTPDAAGRADVAVTIRRGTATNVEVTTDTLPTSVVSCIERAVRGAPFPDAGDDSDLHVRLPFVFQNAD